MTPDEADVLFARIVAHWPNLGGAADDPLARERARSWTDALRRLDAKVGFDAVDRLIREHREPRLPRFADVQDRARAIARDHAEPHRAQRAIEAPAAARQRVAALVAQARDSIDLARQKAKDTERLPQQVSPYDRAEVHWGAEGTLMSEADRLAELEAFGDRHVRRRHP